MSGNGPVFPEYGDGGDYLGARRTRRAFQLCVASCVLFTASLWLSEGYLRYEPAERLYVRSLTLPPESARVYLRQAVKIDEKTRQFPTPKYLQALAVREEQDLILPTFKRAYESDPTNADVAVRYGCRLFLAGRAEEARERFREAAVHAPDNALPMYLEAAVVPWTDAGDEHLDESLALIARTNSSGRQVMMPRPLWFSGLPRQGRCYARLRRQIVDECCAPLYRYTRLLASDADSQIAQKHIQHWDSWLATIQRTGERLTMGNELGSLQAIAGISIQLAALEERERIGELEHGTRDEKLIARRLKLQSALEVLRSFESSRESKLELDRSKYFFPFRLLGWALAILAASYLLCFIFSKAVPVRRAPWSIPHTVYGKTVLLGGSFFLLLVLESVIPLQRVAVIRLNWMDILAVLWWVAMFGTVSFGAIYPSFALPVVQRVARDAGKIKEPDDVLHAARRGRRAAYLVLLRRYYGALTALVLCVSCIWIVSYRILTSLYPYQLALLTTGLAEEEAAAVHQALALLN